MTLRKKLNEGEKLWNMLADIDEGADFTTNSAAKVTLNRITGQSAEAHAQLKIQSEGYKIVGSQVYVQTPFGYRVYDYIGIKNNSYEYFEVKANGGKRSWRQETADRWVANNYIEVRSRNQRGLHYGQFLEGVPITVIHVKIGIK